MVRTLKNKHSKEDRSNTIANTYQGCGLTGFPPVTAAGLEATITQVEQCQWYREAKVWKLCGKNRPLELSPLHTLLIHCNYHNHMINAQTVHVTIIRQNTKSTMVPH